MARTSSPSRFLFLTLLILCSHASHVFTAFPLPNVDIPHVGNVGGRYSSMFFPITKDSIFNINDIPDDLFIEILTNPSYRSRGILFLLPKFLDKKAMSRLNALEREFSSHSTSVPIAFAPEDVELRNLYERIKENNLFQSGHLYFKLKTNAPSSPARIHTIQGWLYGKGNPKKIPTLAVVANYDSFSMLPPFASNLNRPTSGAIALLECLRLFQQIYANPATRPAANIVFVLTTGSAIHNYEGVRSWWNRVGKEKDAGNAPTSVLFLDAMAAPAQAKGNSTLKAFYSKRSREQVREEEINAEEEGTSAEEQAKEGEDEETEALGVFSRSGDRYDDKTVPPLMLAVRDAAERCGFVVREEGNELRNVPSSIREERRELLDTITDEILDKIHEDPKQAAEKKKAEEEEEAEEAEEEKEEENGEEEEEEEENAPKAKPKTPKKKSSRRRSRGAQNRRMLPLRPARLPHEVLSETGELDAVTLSTLPPAENVLGPRPPPRFILDYQEGIRALYHLLTPAALLNATEEEEKKEGQDEKKTDGSFEAKLAEARKRAAEKATKKDKEKEKEKEKERKMFGDNPALNDLDMDVFTNIFVHTSGMDADCEFDTDSLVRNTRTAAEIILAFVTQPEKAENGKEEEGNEEEEDHIVSLGRIFPAGSSNSSTASHPQCLVSSSSSSASSSSLFSISADNIRGWYSFFSSLTATTASSSSSAQCPGLILPSSFYTPSSLSNHTRMDSFIPEDTARSALLLSPLDSPSSAGASAIRSVRLVMGQLADRVIAASDSVGRNGVSIKSGLAGSASVYATLPRGQFLVHTLLVLLYLAILFVGLSYSPFGTFEMPKWKKDKKEKKEEKEGEGEEKKGKKGGKEKKEKVKKEKKPAKEEEPAPEAIAKDKKDNIEKKEEKKDVKKRGGRKEEEKKEAKEEKKKEAEEKKKQEEEEEDVEIPEIDTAVLSNEEVGDDDDNDDDDESDQDIDRVD